MARKKSNSRNAARALESLVSPILEVNYEDPLFTVAAHPSKPILLSGLVTGHIYCNTYDAAKLEESQSTKREELELLEKEAFKQGKISQVNKSVSQTKKKWWSVINDIKDVDEQSHVVTNWKTKRHKGSCRHAIFDPLESSLGENIYTVGTDHIIKKAATETGKVVGKVSIVDHFTGKDSVTKLCHSTTHPFLLSGTEDGHVLVFDSKNLGSDKLKFKVEKAHDDAINYILPMSDVSAYHYLTLGSTTLSHIDIRKGIINQSDDQEDELLSMCYANDTEKNDMVLVSHGEGIITIWKNSKNRFQDQLTRIKVNKSASIDAIVPTMNNEDDEMSSSVWCGDSEGLLHRVNYKQGKVVETRVHSSLVGKVADEVGILDIDYDYRLISAGMDSLKIWSNQAVEPTEDSDSGWDDTDDENGGDNDGPDDDSDDDSDSSDGFSATDDSGSDIEDASDDIDGASDVSIEDIEGRAHDGGEDIPDEDDEEDEEEEEEKEEKEEEAKDKSIQFLQTRRRNFAEIIKSSQPKKKTIDFNKLSKPEEPEETPNKKQKIKKKQMTTKQLSSLQKHEHGIRRFDGL